MNTVMYPVWALYGNLTIIFTKQDGYNNNNFTDLPTSKRQKFEILKFEPEKVVRNG